MDHPRFLYDLEHCSIRRALEVLGEKWTMLVLREAFYGVCRFDDFARALGCGRGVLSARLKTLTEAGILERREYRSPIDGPARNIVSPTRAAISSRPSSPCRSGASAGRRRRRGPWRVSSAASRGGPSPSS
jgi:DNA-binding HxlR family transcriptional regulator